ncbi:hypothetical protein [Herbidospora mongoliensis]|uniref:hypothetical protein n=1 Tax=Herbidospora mongoliensis TaxID=688067 RepID=UPI00082BD3AC|nr:hypothetical protein [Herbidospora mongoliensis]
MKIRLWTPPAVVLAAAIGMFAFGTQGAAQAEPQAVLAQHGHGDVIRYASAKGCVVKGNTVPCGDWRLVTHHGKVVLLKDAQVRALEKKGKPSSEITAPLTVSGDGTKVAYFRKDGRLVVRTFNGPVKVLPRNALPAKLGQGYVNLKLSDDGAALAITNNAVDETSLYDTVSGKRLGRLPKEVFFYSFSGDGKEVLTDSRTKLGVNDLSGRLLFPRHTPPDAITETPQTALHADGKRIAVIQNGRKVVVYDLATKRVVSEKPIKLPKDSSVDELDWTGKNQVTLHVSKQSGSAPARITVLEHDVKSGATKVRETYTLLKDTFTYATCGG